jgi:hypothetical protein
MWLYAAVTGRAEARPVTVGAPFLLGDVDADEAD